MILPSCHFSTRGCLWGRGGGSHLLYDGHAVDVVTVEALDPGWSGLQSVYHGRRAGKTSCGPRLITVVTWDSLVKSEKTIPVLMEAKPRNILLQHAQYVSNHHVLSARQDPAPHWVNNFEGENLFECLVGFSILHHFLWCIRQQPVCGTMMNDLQFCVNF